MVAVLAGATTRAKEDDPPNFEGDERDERRFQYDAPIDFTEADADKWKQAEETYLKIIGENYFALHMSNASVRIQDAFRAFTDSKDPRVHVFALDDMASAYDQDHKTPPLHPFTPMHLPRNDQQMMFIIRKALQSNDPLIRFYGAKVSWYRDNSCDRVIEKGIIDFLSLLLDTDAAWSRDHPEHLHRPLNSYRQEAKVGLQMLSAGTANTANGQRALPILLRTLHLPCLSVEAASALLRMDVGKQQLLEHVQNSQQPLALRLDIIKVLCTQMCDNESLLLFITLLDDKDHHIRAAAAQALGAKGPAALEAVPQLLSIMTEDRQAFPRTAAYDALRQIAPENPDVQKAMVAYRKWVEEWAAGFMK